MPACVCVCVCVCVGVCGSDTLFTIYREFIWVFVLVFMAAAPKFPLLLIEEAVTFESMVGHTRAHTDTRSPNVLIARYHLSSLSRCVAALRSFYFYLRTGSLI